MKNIFYFLVILSFLLIQPSSTLSLDYNVGDNSSMIDVFEKVGSTINNITNQNNTPEFITSETTIHNKLEYNNIGISSILSDYLDKETRMLQAVSVGKLLTAVVTMIAKIVINEIKLMLNFF